MHHQIEGVLETTKYQNTELSIGPVSVPDLIQEIKEELPLLERQDAWEINLDDIPIIYGDKHLLKKLLFNLLDNSLKYNDSTNPKVNVQYQLDPKFHHFSVIDNGVGIPVEYHDQVFKLFKKLDYANGFDGIGIGLTNCKQIVDLHGGKIWIESNEKSGTTFNFTLAKKINLILFFTL